MHPFTSKVNRHTGHALERHFRYLPREMIWLAIEILAGLALFVFIVWWTLPKKDKR